MKLSDCIADYLNHIRFERGLAKTTCLHYQCWLRHFTDWLTENGSLDYACERTAESSPSPHYLGDRYV